MSRPQKWAIFLTFIAIAVGIATVGLWLAQQPIKVDGLTELKHADLVIRDNIIVHGSTKEGMTFDEGYGTIYTTETGWAFIKVAVYENVHWAICYGGQFNYGGPEFIVYAWND